MILRELKVIYIFCSNLPLPIHLEVNLWERNTFQYFEFCVNLKDTGCYIPVITFSYILRCVMFSFKMFVFLFIY